MPDWEDSGTHRFCRQDDLLLWQLRGTVLLADVLDLWRRNRAIRDHYGYVLLLIDGTDGGMLVPEARRQIVDFKRSEPDSLGRVAVFGVSALSRVLLTLVSRAMYLVVKREVAVTLCASESEARAWLDECRTQLQEQLKAGPTNPLTGPGRSD